MAGHDAAEALAAAVLLVGFVLLVRRAALPRGWPRVASRRRGMIRATGALAATGAFLTAAAASGGLAAAPPLTVVLLLAAAMELVLAAAWLVRPRLRGADRLAGIAAATGVGWLVAWSGALPLGGHVGPGPDQMVAVVLQVTVLLWLTVATRRPAIVAPMEIERVRWPHERVLAPARAAVGGRPGGVANRP